MTNERMMAMFTIVNRGDGLALAKLYAQNNVHLHLQIIADGTASSELLSTLGLTQRERDMLIGFGPESYVSALLNRLDDDYRGILRVRGIAYSVKLSAISDMVAQAFTNNAPSEGGISMHSDKEYTLILAVVHHGRTDAVMQTACKAGATGGTVIRGRFVGSEPLEQFHSITLQEEREILAIACTKERRNAIMDAITANHGMHTEEQGFICALPIERFVRLA